MATAAPTTQEKTLPSPTTPIGLLPYRISTETYLRIADSGALETAPGVILWDGQIVQKIVDLTKNRPRVTASNQLDNLLGKVVGEGYFVEQEQPITLGRDRVPEPDLKCVRGTPRDYLEQNPTPENVPLIVEVADSSPALDQGEMLRAYAEASIPVYWIVNIPLGRIDFYSGPTGPSTSPTYREQRSDSPGEHVPVILEGREVGRIAVADILS